MPLTLPLTLPLTFPAGAHGFCAAETTKCTFSSCLIFTVREPRRITHGLTLQYDKNLYLLMDTPAARSVIGQYVEMYEYPDGRIEVRANGAALPYTIYDRLSDVDQGAIVDNKRLGHVLQIAQMMQEQRDSRRGRSAPARTNQGHPSVQLKAAPGTKSQRALDANDLAQSIVKTNAKQVPSKF